jgi:hypothetical protein
MSTAYVAVKGIESMCRSPVVVQDEVLAVCTRKQGHRGQHWMEAPQFPRVAWERQAKKGRAR